MDVLGYVRLASLVAMICYSTFHALPIISAFSIICPFSSSVQLPVRTSQTITYNAMSSQDSNNETTGPQMLEALKGSGLHVTEDGRIQDKFGDPKKAQEQRSATEFTDKELNLLRRWCSAACAEFGEELERDEIFRELETFMPNHSAATMKKKWEEIKALPRLLPDVWNTPFPGLKSDTGSRAAAAGHGGMEKKQEGKEPELEEHEEDK